MPPLAELKEIPELDPQLPFDRVPQVASAAMINAEEISEEKTNGTSDENSDEGTNDTNEELKAVEMTSDDENETNNDEADDIAEPEYKNE
mgnify:CR=1 FL=1